MRRFLFVLLLTLHLAGGPALAAVPVVTPEVTYTANGSATSYAYAFRIFDDSDLVVKVDGVTQTLTDDYTVTGAGDPAGGTVVFGSAPASSAAVKITRATPMDRETDYTTSGPLRAATLNADLDRIVTQAQDRDFRLGNAEGDIVGLDARMDTAEADIDTNAADITQEIVDRGAGDDYLQGQVTSNTGGLARALKFPAGDTTNPELPSVSARASKVLGFNMEGKPEALGLTGTGSYTVSTIPVADALAQYDADGRLGGTVKPVDDYAAAQALTGLTEGTQIYVAEEGRGGLFTYRTGDFTTEIAADAQHGIYLPGANGDATGESGCLVRNDREGADIRWFGAVNNTDSAAAVQSALGVADSIVVRQGNFKIGTSITIQDGKTIHIEESGTLSADAALVGPILKNADQIGGNSQIKIVGLGNIDGSDIATEGIDLRLVSNLTIAGIGVKNCTRYGIYTYKIYDADLTDIKATANGGAGHFNYSGVGINGSEIRIINNKLYANVGNGLRYWHDSAINTARLTFVANVFRDNQQHGLLGNPESTLTPMTQVLLVGNKAHGNGSGNMYSGFAMHYTSQVTAVGNLGYNNAEHGYVAMDGASHTLTANTWRANGFAGVRIQGDFVRPEDSQTGARGIDITGDQFLGNGASADPPAALKGGAVISGNCRDIKISGRFENNAGIAVRSNSVSGYTDSWDIYVEDSTFSGDKLYNGTPESRFYYDNIRRDGGFYHTLKAADGLLSKSRGKSLHLINRTADYTLDPSESGVRIANAGSVAHVTAQLPPAVQGLSYSFSRTSSGFELRVDPDGTEVIRGGGAGKYLIIAPGGSATIECINAGVWEFTSSYGEHTYEP